MVDENVLDEDVGDAESAFSQGSVQGETEGLAVEGDSASNNVGDWLILEVIADGLVLNSLRLSVDTLETTGVELSAGNAVALLSSQPRSLNSMHANDVLLSNLLLATLD